MAILSSSSFMSFLNAHNKSLGVAHFVNKSTKEPFTKLVIGGWYITWAKNLGELPISKVKEMRNDLQIVELPRTAEEIQKLREKGYQERLFVLCMKGEGGKNIEPVDTADW